MADLPPNCTRIKYKIALAGNYGVGKTSLFRRMFNMGFDTGVVSGIDFKVHREIFEEDNTVIELEIWDTAEMERYGSISQSYYKGSHFVLLVYSVANDLSLEELENVAKDVHKYEPRAKLFLVRNKVDLPLGNDSVSLEKQNKYIEEMDCKIHCVFPTSAKKNTGIEEMLKKLATYVLGMSKRKGSTKSSQEAGEGGGFRPYLEPEPQPKQGCCT